MKKRAIIIDLDNTIYPVSSIGEKLFKSLFELIQEKGEYTGDLEIIKTEIMRRPFQFVAKEFSFSQSLLDESMNLLQSLTYEDEMLPFEDYDHVKGMRLEKFLVTVGFTKMQESKVRQLKIQDDFKAIYIIDPEKTDLVKKDIFIRIMAEHHYDAAEVLVVGDDLNSEINAAGELGIDAVLYDRAGIYKANPAIRAISSFEELNLHLIAE